MQRNKNAYEPLRWALALTTLAGLLMLGGCRNGNAQQQQAPAPIPEVATVTIQPQRVDLTTELPGRTSPYLVSEIRPQVNGIIQKRLFREGSDVKAGQLLYQIDPAPFQVALDSAKASLGKAQANLPSIRSRAERYRELLVDKAVSRQDYDDAAAAVQQAQAEIEYWKTQVEAARINLGYTQVNAPISGRIGKSSVTDGALVTAYQPAALSTIQQLDPIYVDVAQSSAELLRLKRNLETGQLSAEEKRESRAHPPGRRNELSPRRQTAIPGCYGGPGDRVLHGAHRGPQPGASPPARYVCAGHRPGGHCRTGHPGSAAGSEPQHEGGSRCPGRG